MQNMGRPSGGNRVRYGKRGEGVLPNYQVEAVDGVVVCFSAKSHRQSRTYSKFQDQNLSRPYSFAEVQEMLERSLSSSPPS
ncbi:hypothetical protein X756_22680 [Mesorhizobium sp. LSHC412B00]|nr:hypothetical protein X756_22680 [Mesorhizobium sp. LSHC412B00]